MSINNLRLRRRRDNGEVKGISVEKPEGAVIASVPTT